ncbi:MAG TPA: cytochrome C, partial [Alcanivorax sp.]|nr:cytochrome C [Alcanivorax sp.]
MVLIERRPLGVFLLLCFFMLTATARAADQTALVQLVEYVGADYVNAVQDGEIVSEAEYAEMDEFTRLLSEGIATLDDVEGKQRLADQAQQLEAAVDDI